MNDLEDISRADFVILTPLPEERDAILARLTVPRKVLPSESDIRMYYCELMQSKQRLE